MLEPGDGNSETLEIVHGEANLNAGLDAASLFACSSGKNADETRAELREDRFEGTGKSGAIGQQQHDSRNAPCHTDHGDHCSTPVVNHGVVGLS